MGMWCEYTTPASMVQVGFGAVLVRNLEWPQGEGFGFISGIPMEASRVMMAMSIHHSGNILLLLAPWILACRSRLG